MAKSFSLRALVLEPSGNLWGSERVLLDFLGVASKSEWQIGVCCPPNTPILEPLSQLPLEVFPVFEANLHLLGRAQRLRAMLRLLRLARRFRPRLIYVNQAGATRIALAVGRLLRIPVVTHVRLAEDVKYVASLGASAKSLPTVICISDTIRRMFDEQSVVSTTQLEMLYDAYTMQSKTNDIVSTDGFSTNETIFSCVGRIENNKRQDVLIESIKVLNQKDVLTHGLFIGVAKEGDDFGKYVQNLCADLGIANQVTWAGFQREVLLLLAQSSVVVCPFQQEALGRVVFEAWDAGTLPVAWAGSGGPAEVISQSGGGLLYREQSGESLADTLQTVLSMRSEDKAAMIEAGRVWLRSNCDPATYTHQMLDWWEEVERAQ